MTIHSIVAKKDGKTRIGKGFSKNELKEAGVDFKQALRMAIPVDLRRKTRHEENVTILRQRLGVQAPKVSKPPVPPKEPSKETVKPVKEVSKSKTRKVTEPTKKKTAEAKPSKLEKAAKVTEAPKAREVSKAKKPVPKKTATKRKTTKSKRTEKT